MAEAKTVAQLKKEIKQLKEQLTRADTAGSEKTFEFNDIAENEKYMMEPVTIKLFKDNGKYKDDIYVCVNEHSYLIKRGVEVTVPRFVEQTLKNSLEQDEYVASLVEQLVSNYEHSNV